jgi:predicted dithiol-disulfide oxidoreductase (DUF899 family)
MKPEANHNQMNSPRVVSRAEWLFARKQFLAKEKEFTRRRDALNAELQTLPMVKIEKDYVFDGPNGRSNLRDLFGDHRQLIVYHFMFDPSWEQGCKSCSHFMDTAEGAIVHLAARHTAFVVVSRAQLAKIEPFKKRMGWTFPWFSSFGTDFNYDFHVTLDPEKGDYEYNYESAKTLFENRKIWFSKGELPGLSAFVRDGDQVFHTYSTYQRGLDQFLNTYNFLDQTALGRHEEDAPGQSWIRHHDSYSANSNLSSITPAGLSSAARVESAIS